MTKRKTAMRPISETDRKELASLLHKMIASYGAAAVSDAVKDLVKVPNHRPPLPDGDAIWEVCKQDARDWLEGNDTTARKTNYAIIQEITADTPQHLQSAAARRLYRKLAQRPYWTKVAAVTISRTHYSLASHVRACRELYGDNPDSASGLLYSNLLEVKAAQIKQVGGLFNPLMTKAEVEEEYERLCTLPETAAKLAMLNDGDG